MSLNLSNFQTKIFAHSNNQFLQDIKKFDIPTPEEELTLFELAKNGNKEAKNKLFMGHQRFIYALAKHYSKNETEVLDYVNEGNIGLSIAFDKYNPTVGVRFITYASHYIRREMGQYLNETEDLVRKCNKNKFKTKINEIKKSYFNENGCYPSLDEIINQLNEKYGLKVKNKCDIYDTNISSINIDKDDDNYNSEIESSYNIKTSSYNDYNKTIEYEAIKNDVSIILSTVSERDADIIKMIYGIGYPRPYSFEEIAEKHNLKDTSINIFKNKILEKLRKTFVYKQAI